MRHNINHTHIAIASALLFAQSATADVIYINAAAPDGGDGMSWATAFNDLQDGLAAATPGSGDQLWVAAGIYKPTVPAGDRAISFNLVSGTAVYGGFNGTETKLEQRDPAVNVTVLSGDLNGNDVGNAVDPSHGENSVSVVRGQKLAGRTILDGLTITAAYADNLGVGAHFEDSSIDIVNCSITMNASHGLIHIGGAIAITNSRIIHNRAVGEASAIGVFCGQAILIMTNCEVSHNVSESTGGAIDQGGGMLLSGTYFAIQDCVFEANKSEQGGAIQCGSLGLTPGAGTIANCTIVNNIQKYAGALLIQDTTVVSGCRFIANHTEQLGGAVSVSLPPNEHATLQNCFFAGNTAQVGGGLHSAGNTNVINCVFTGNKSTLDGGAIHFSGISPRILEDCTIAGNVAGWWGGGIHRDATVGVSMRNTILWGNTDFAGSGESSQYHNGVGSGPIRFCTVQGWTGVLGDDSNSGIDPQFVDADGPDNIAGTEDDNLRLIVGSPSINRGEPSMPPLHPVDIDGNPRVQECIVDIGAYEAADADPLLPDCNGNGVQDACDIVALVSVDCNRNVVPDDCDIAGGFSSDLDANEIPDDCQGVPSNDNCSASKLVPTGPSVVTNLFATTDGPAGQVGCGFSGGGGDDQIHNDVWYRFVAQCGGIVTINLCNVNFDARVGVYFGCPSVGSQPIACSDNDCGSAPRVSFLNAGPLLYRIRVGGAPGSAGIGGGTMVITCTPSAQCPGDANGDGNVNITDLLLVISNWGQNGLNPADVNGDSIVNVADLLGVIAAWGPCL